MWKERGGCGRVGRTVYGEEMCAGALVGRPVKCSNSYNAVLRDILRTSSRTLSKLSDMTTN